MRFVLFGDDYGIKQLCGFIPAEFLQAIVAAENRPQYHHWIVKIADSRAVDFLIQPKKTSANYISFINHVKNINPNFIFVNSYSMLLPPEILEIPKCGAINIHSALLPQYRGANPIQWALLNDEKETGATIHYMDAGFDTGDIIAQKKVPILEEDTWLDIQQRIGCATDQMLAEEIPKIVSGTNSRMRQRDDLARYWKRRRPEDGRFEWTWRARDIYNLIRALVKPHAGAFYYDKNGHKVVIDSFLSLHEVKMLQMAQIGHVIG